MLSTLFILYTTVNPLMVIVNITTLEVTSSFVNIRWTILPNTVTITSVRLNISRIDPDNMWRIPIQMEDFTNNSENSRCLSGLDSNSVYEFCVVVTTDRGVYSDCERSNSGTSNNPTFDTSGCQTIVGGLGIIYNCLSLFLLLLVFLVLFP